MINQLPLRHRGRRWEEARGDIVAHVAVIRPGRIIFEVGGLTEKLAKESLRIAGEKLPLRTKIVSQRIK